jgi:hypothetical protein
MTYVHWGLLMLQVDFPDDLPTSIASSHVVCLAWPRDSGPSTFFNSDRHTMLITPSRSSLARNRCFRW